MLVNIGRPATVITDWDNVLQIIDIPWFLSLFESDDKYCQELVEGIISKIKNSSDINQELADILLGISDRKEYYIEDFLINTFDLHHLNVAEIKKSWVKLYLDNKTFYNDAPVTILYTALRTLLLNDSNIHEMIVLTHVLDGDDDRKTEKFKSLFPSGNVKLVQLSKNESKADWIMKNYPNYDLFIDDRSDIVEELIKKDKDSIKKEYVIPSFGYNQELSHKYPHHEISYVKLI